MNSIPFPPLGAAMLLVAGIGAHAQSTPQVVVTGNPLGRGDALAPASVLAGDALTLRQGATIGDTLAGLPGVAATAFGPQSSRPVIRGQDGERIRLLGNGIASTDASSLSQDHAVAIEPLLVERIEVLRGPAALLYGGSATGGVIDLQDGRIPRQPVRGLNGRAELRAGGAGDQRAAVAAIGGGDGRWSWHADAAGRRTDDLRLPEGLRVANSAGNSRSGAVGARTDFTGGWLGMAFDGYRNDYGVAVEPDVTIRMRRRQWQMASEFTGLSGPLAQLEWRAGATGYRHQEVEGGGEVGTTFDSHGRHLRLQARQAPRALGGGQWQGVVGLQLERTDFEALGEEAFVPPTATRHAGVFTLQEWCAGAWSASAGGRLDRVRVASAGDAADAQVERFGRAQQRRYSPAQAAVALQWVAAPAWTLRAALSHAERAPSDYELYANGHHVATGSYERGDPALPLERGHHIDLGLQWKGAAHQLAASVYAMRFSSYLALQATGREIASEDDDGEPLPEFQHRAVAARLHGAEIEGRWRLTAADAPIDLRAAFDMVRGRERDGGTPLPRLAPWRATLGLERTHGAWRMGVEAQRVATQRRVADYDTPTPGYTWVRLWAAWHQQFGEHSLQWLARLDNAGDTLAWQATALPKARAIAPLGGRALTLGLRATW